MSWFTDANCEAEAAKENVILVYAADLDFPSGHVRYSTYVGNLTIAGNVYTGIGSLGSIADVPERMQLTTERWSYLLAGVDPSVVPESEIDNCYGRSVTEYQAWLNPDTRALVGYEIRREGRMGKVRRKDGAAPFIEVNCDTRLAGLEQSDAWRYTPEHQAQFFSGDTGLDQVREIESVKVMWGGKSAMSGPFHGSHVYVRS
jgi:hypothetical protein